MNDNNQDLQDNNQPRYTESIQNNDFVEEQDSSKSSTKRNKKPLVVAIFIVLVLSLSLFIYITFIQHDSPEFVMGKLDERYRNQISDISFESKESCMERYSTIAGDSGSGRRKIINCSIEIYSVKLKNGRSSRVYISNNDEGKNVYQDIDFTNMADIIENYKDELQISDIAYEYIDQQFIREYAISKIEPTQSRRKIILFINDSMQNVLTSEYLTNVYKMNDSVEEYMSRQDVKQKDVNFIIGFKDGTWIDTHSGEQFFKSGGGNSPYIGFLYKSKYKFNTIRDEIIENAEANDFLNKELEWDGDVSAYSYDKEGDEYLTDKIKMMYEMRIRRAY